MKYNKYIKKYYSVKVEECLSNTPPFPEYVKKYDIHKVNYLEIVIPAMFMFFLFLFSRHILLNHTYKDQQKFNSKTIASVASLISRGTINGALYLSETNIISRRF